MQKKLTKNQLPQVKEGRMGDAEINVYLSKHLEYLKERTKHHLGYPYNLAFSSDNLVP